ncbi:hypothetical protein DUNSADRAFT_3619 [Dunaliella salina]|uniref:Secreted protein n=1 Tax=Dunaliella salina TaxID=3046 RepID=A0ABQ7GTP9_DUNSA|nr:hypothetical protein DUNSADRAFT_3619 [Dunaliella salina]|eukprot:KAF5837958.1 hypothetical protein DUNSADRAFT_3619 [Dunaliella salina]
MAWCLQKWILCLRSWTWRSKSSAKSSSRQWRSTRRWLPVSKKPLGLPMRTRTTTPPLPQPPKPGCRNASSCRPSGSSWHTRTCTSRWVARV